MSSQGPNSAGTGENSGTGVTWTTPTYVTVSDGKYAHSSNKGSLRILRVTQFGFSIPAGATINGVYVETQRKKVIYGGDISPYGSLQLQNNGTNLGTAKSLTAWPSKEAWDNWGGTDDVWDASLTSEIINATTFGVDFVGVGVTSILAGAYVNCVKITVYYTLVLVSSSESIAASDQATCQTGDPIVITNEAAALTDTPVLVIAIQAQANEDCNVSETSASYIEITALVQDSITVSEDYLENVSTPLMSVSDSIDTDESIILNVSSLLTESTENIGSSDTGSAYITTAIDISENIIANDSNEAVIGINSIANESSTLGESLAQSLEICIETSDSLLVDDIPWYPDDEVFVYEHIVVADTPRFSSDIAVSTLDSTVVHETNNAVIDLYVSADDEINVFDQSTLALVQQASALDDIAVDSSASAKIAIDIANTENIHVTDSPFSSSTLRLITSDELTIFDLVGVTSVLGLAVTESASISESASLIPSIDVIKLEMLSIQEIISISMPEALSINVQDNTLASDLANTCLVNLLNVSDVINVAEYIPDLSSVFMINLSDNISVTDIINDIYVTYPSYQPPIAGSAAQVSLSTSGDGNVNLEISGGGAVERINNSTGSPRNNIGGGSGRVLGG